MPSMLSLVFVLIMRLYQQHGKRGLYIHCLQVICSLFHEHNDFTVCAQALAQSASKALSAFLCKTRNFGDWVLPHIPKLFHTGIASILDYGGGVWGYKKTTCIDNIQHRAIRAFLGVGKYMPNLALDSLMGWTSSHNRRQTHMVRLWNRIGTLGR